MAMQETRNDKNDGTKGGLDARTEEGLYEKAITLLDRCKIAARRPGKGRAGA